MLRGGFALSSSWPLKRLNGFAQVQFRLGGLTLLPSSGLPYYANSIIKKGSIYACYFIGEIDHYSTGNINVILLFI